MKTGLSEKLMVWTTSARYSLVFFFLLLYIIYC